MAPRRLALAAPCAALILAAGASAALADPPWSPPAVVPGAGNGPAAATARGHVAALVTSNRTQPPGTASHSCA